MSVDSFPCESVDQVVEKVQINNVGCGYASKTKGDIYTSITEVSDVEMLVRLEDYNDLIPKEGIELKIDDHL